MTAAQRELLLGPDRKTDAKGRRRLSMDEMKALSNRFAAALARTSKTATGEGEDSTDADGDLNLDGLMGQTVDIRPEDVL